MIVNEERKKHYKSLTKMAIESAREIVRSCRDSSTNDQLEEDRKDPKFKDAKKYILERGW